MKILNHKGFSMLEALASVFIISLVLTTSIAIIANVRNQVIASDRQIAAIEVGSLIRDQIIKDMSYESLSLWIGETEKIVDAESCSLIDIPLSCSLFEYTLNNTTYNENVLIMFDAPTEQSQLFKVIHFTIEITYHETRKVRLEGIIYE